MFSAFNPYILTDKKIISTIGHSTRPFEEFVNLLVAYQIQHLIDIRRYPGSKRYPQYNKEVLSAALLHYNIAYTHMEELGGRRNPRTDSINTAWRVKAFRGYADYMETDTFKKAASGLEQIAVLSRCAVMCSEAVWWGCHRALLSDWLKINGWQVMHIMNKEKEQQHPYTKAAVVRGGTLSYSDSNQLF